MRPASLKGYDANRFSQTYRLTEWFIELKNITHTLTMYVMKSHIYIYI